MEDSLIKHIVLSLGGEEVTVDIKQAKKLHCLLDELFGDKTKTIEHYNDRPYFPQYPIVIRGHDPYWEYPCYTWSSCEAGDSSDPYISFCMESNTACIAV